jgi:hypothetical protein
LIAGNNNINWLFNWWWLRWANSEFMWRNINYHAWWLWRFGRSDALVLWRKSSFLFQNLASSWQDAVLVPLKELPFFWHLSVTRWTIMY